MMTAIALVSGCASTCSATPDKLAALRRGMTYSEATAVMGCPGGPIAPENTASQEVSTIEWNGPSLIFMATQIDFLDDRLLYYVVKTRGGL
jgi:hypothetical protein